MNTYFQQLINIIKKSRRNDLNIIVMYICYTSQIKTFNNNKKFS